MSRDGMHLLGMLALQHLWQGAMLLAMAWLAVALQPRLSAQVRSRVWLCALVLATILPLAVLLPGDAKTVTADAPVVSTPRQLVPAASGESLATDVATAHGSSSGSTWRTDAGMLLLGIWLLGLGWSLCRLWMRWNGARRLHRESSRPHDADSRISRALPHGVSVRVSDNIASPMVIGLTRPCVLLPRDLFDDASPDTLAHVLNHELAHVQRGDLWVAWVQALSLAVYWWSPLLRLISARLDMHREMACDERASIQSGSAIDYANALLASTRSALLHARSGHTLAIGIFESRAALTRRLEALLNMNIARSIHGKKAMILASSSMIFLSTSLTLLATPRLGPALPTARASHADDARVLIDAVVNKRLDTLRALVGGGADVNAGLAGDGTALIVAAKHGDTDIIRELIKLGAHVDQPSPGDGNPLIAAAAYDHLEAAKLLVAAGASIDAIVVGDETPLINAARSGDLAMVQYLVEQGADVNLGMVADWGKWRSPLNQAANAEIKRYLQSKGATPHRP
jgi:beta-lactamase regulating signal transducer with metallopeptidase domain